MSVKGPPVAASGTPVRCTGILLRPGAHGCKEAGAWLGNASGWLPPARDTAKTLPLTRIRFDGVKPHEDRGTER